MRRNVKAFAVGATLVISLGLGMAFAAWTASTAGNHAAAKYGSLQGVTAVDAQAFTTGDCFPSSTCTLTFRFHNPNAQAVSVSTVTTSGYNAVGGGTCTTPAATLAASYSINQSIPGGGDATVNVANGATIGGGVSNDCQAQTVDFTGLTVNTTT